MKNPAMMVRVGRDRRYTARSVPDLTRVSNHGRMSVGSGVWHTRRWPNPLLRPGTTGDHTAALGGNIRSNDTVRELAVQWGAGFHGRRGSRAVLSRLLAAFAALALCAALPAHAKSEKSR